MCAQKDVMHLCHLQLVIIWSLDLKSSMKMGQEWVSKVESVESSIHLVYLLRLTLVPLVTNVRKKPCKIKSFNSWKKVANTKICWLCKTASFYMNSKMHFQIPCTYWTMTALVKILLLFFLEWSFIKCIKQCSWNKFPQPQDLSSLTTLTNFV